MYSWNVVWVGVPDSPARALVYVRVVAGQLRTGRCERRKSRDPRKA